MGSMGMGLEQVEMETLAYGLSITLVVLGAVFNLLLPCGNDPDRGFDWWFYAWLNGGQRQPISIPDPVQGAKYPHISEGYENRNKSSSSSTKPIGTDTSRRFSGRDTSLKDALGLASPPGKLPTLYEIYIQSPDGVVFWFLGMSRSCYLLFYALYKDSLRDLIIVTAVPGILLCLYGIYAFVVSLEEEIAPTLSKGSQKYAAPGTQRFLRIHKRMISFLSPSGFFLRSRVTEFRTMEGFIVYFLRMVIWAVVVAMYWCILMSTFPLVLLSRAWSVSRSKKLCRMGFMMLILVFIVPVVVIVSASSVPLYAVRLCGHPCLVRKHCSEMRRVTGTIEAISSVIFLCFTRTNDTLLVVGTVCCSYSIMRCAYNFGIETLREAEDISMAESKKDPQQAEPPRENNKNSRFGGGTIEPEELVDDGGRGERSSSHLWQNEDSFRHSRSDIYDTGPQSSTEQNESVRRKQSQRQQHTQVTDRYANDDENMPMEQESCGSENAPDPSLGPEIESYQNNFPHVSYHRQHSLGSSVALVSDAPEAAHREYDVPSRVHQRSLLVSDRRLGEDTTTTTTMTTTITNRQESFGADEENTQKCDEKQRGEYESSTTKEQHDSCGADFYGVVRKELSRQRNRRMEESSSQWRNVYINAVATGRRNMLRGDGPPEPTMEGLNATSSGPPDQRDSCADSSGVVRKELSRHNSYGNNERSVPKREGFEAQDGRLEYNDMSRGDSFGNSSRERHGAEREAPPEERRNEYNDVCRGDSFGSIENDAQHRRHPPTDVKIPLDRVRHDFSCAREQDKKSDHAANPEPRTTIGFAKEVDGGYTQHLTTTKEDRGRIEELSSDRGSIDSGHTRERNVGTPNLRGQTGARRIEEDGRRRGESFEHVEGTTLKRQATTADAQRNRRMEESSSQRRNVYNGGATGSRNMLRGDGPPEPTMEGLNATSSVPLDQRCFSNAFFHPPGRECTLDDASQQVYTGRTEEGRYDEAGHYARGQDRDALISSYSGGARDLRNGAMSNGRNGAEWAHDAREGEMRGNGALVEPQYAYEHRRNDAAALVESQYNIREPQNISDNMRGDNAALVESQYYREPQYNIREPVLRQVPDHRVPRLDLDSFQVKREGGNIMSDTYHSGTDWSCGGVRAPRNRGLENGIHQNERGDVDLSNYVTSGRTTKACHDMVNACDDAIKRLQENLKRPERIVQKPFFEYKVTLTHKEGSRIVWDFLKDGAEVSDFVDELVPGIGMGDLLYKCEGRNLIGESSKEIQNTWYSCMTRTKPRKKITLHFMTRKEKSEQAKRRLAYFRPCSHTIEDIKLTKKSV